MKNLHTQASVFYLRDWHHYSLDDAVQKAENVSLYEGTMLEYAANYLAEVVESGLIHIPKQFATYIQLDADKLAREERMNGNWAQFEFENRQWTCLNRHDH